MKKIFSQSGIIRQTSLILLSRLVLLELISLALYLIIRVPKIIFPDLISTDVFFTLSGISLLFFLVSTVIEVFLVVYVTLSWANEQYEVRMTDIIHRRGVFSLKEESFSLRNIESITIEQDIIGKIFNFGNLRFFSPVLKQEYVMSNISNPMKQRELVESMVEKAKKSGKKETIIPRLQE